MPLHVLAPNLSLARKLSENCSRKSVASKRRACGEDSTDTGGHGHAIVLSVQTHMVSKALLKLKVVVHIIYNTLHTYPARGGARVGNRNELR